MMFLSYSVHNTMLIQICVHLINTFLHNFQVVDAKWIILNAENNIKYRIYAYNIQLFSFKTNKYT